MQSCDCSCNFSVPDKKVPAVPSTPLSPGAPHGYQCRKDFPLITYTLMCALAAALPGPSPNKYPCMVCRRKMGLTQTVRCQTETPQHHQCAARDSPTPVEQPFPPPWPGTCSKSPLVFTPFMAERELCQGQRAVLDHAFVVNFCILSFLQRLIPFFKKSFKQKQTIIRCKWVERVRTIHKYFILFYMHRK